MRERIIIILWFAQQIHGEGEDNSYTKELIISKR